MRSSRPARRRASMLLAVGLLAATTPLASASADPAPSLRLVRSRSNVTLKTYRDRVPLDLGVWLASAGGDFEVHVGMEDYGDPLTASQVDSTTKGVLRSIPAEDLNGWKGIQRFPEDHGPQPGRANRRRQDAKPLPQLIRQRARR